MREFKEGDSLSDDEYLLKLRPENGGVFTGYLTKLNQNGTIPKAFTDWGYSRYGVDANKVLPTQVVTEEFRIGWYLVGWRFGQSQNWAVMQHPNGYLIEIYMTNLLDILRENTLVNNQLFGHFKWSNHTLIKEKDGN